MRDEGAIAEASARNRAFVDRHDHEFVIVHAAAAARDELTVIFPGSPESGKSTLVAGLVRAGWRHLSDELALFRPGDRRIWTYRRPISIDVGAYDLFPELLDAGYDPAAEQWHVDPADLGGDASLVEPPPEETGRAVTHIVFNRWQAGAATVLEPMRRAEALRQLVGTSVRLRRQTDGFDTLGQLAESTPAFSLLSGSLDEQVAALDTLRVGSPPADATTMETAR